MDSRSPLASVWCWMNDSSQMKRENLNRLLTAAPLPSPPPPSPTNPQKTACGTKETIITDVKSEASEACNNWTSRGEHLCPPTCTHHCLCPLKLHPSLSGFCSQRAHLEMRFKTINVELPRSENTGGTTERFLVQITVFSFCFCEKEMRKSWGRREGGGVTDVAAGHVFLCIQTTMLKAVFSPHFKPFFSSRIITQPRCPSSDNDCLTTEIGN